MAGLPNLAGPSSLGNVQPVALQDPMYVSDLDNLANLKKKWKDAVTDAATLNNSLSSNAYRHKSAGLQLSTANFITETNGSDSHLPGEAVPGVPSLSPTAALIVEQPLQVCSGNTLSSVTKMLAAILLGRQCLACHHCLPRRLLESRPTGVFQAFLGRQCLACHHCLPRQQLQLNHYTRFA
jgi:hypothetical protein